ncbi:FAD/NAD(P)-binding protein [Halobacillus sp. A1]|uniref:FAD/NAD(P)-binding protein n=1 Tax=Halobacillus sp. A1 TaxID=2880262 RepID=UPI0020A69FCC|nr:FAD/NAD(P)-binding protein [Halobacillus sp. A1]MCP3030182.1 FAD/NAD(P)-binding protein [Halobacillus sp. A1]
MSIKKWTIIGGGLHGCTAAYYLLKKGKIRNEDLVIIDPHERPLRRWEKLTGTIGMDYLRSPSVHHISTDPFALQKYAEETDRKHHLKGRYKRPSLQLFNEHSISLMEEINWSKSWYQGTVEDLIRNKEGWSISLVNGDHIQSEHVLLAMGVNDQPLYPGWYDQLHKHQERCVHLFDEEKYEKFKEDPPIAVIGGGISAAHLAIKFGKKYPGQVHLIKRHPFRVHDFDSDPGWLGPKYLSKFEKQKSFSNRRDMIKKARFKGSLNRDVFLRLKRMEEEGKIQTVSSSIKDVADRGGGVDVAFQSGKSQHFKSIVLATGSTPELPEKEWLHGVISRERLSCAECGFPVVDENLQWAPCLHVGGALAELEIGPVSRNISGAKKVAERLLQYQMNANSIKA